MSASHPTFAAAERLIGRLSALGIELYLEGDALGFRAPRGALREEHKAEVKALRNDVIAILRRKANSTAGDIPLSFAQQRLWFLYRLDPSSPQYNIGRFSRVRTPLNVDVFKQAINDLFQRHPAFRTRIFEENGAPRQRIMPTAMIEVQVRKRPGEPEAQRAQLARALAVEALREPLDLASGRISTVRVVSFAPDDHLILITMHHIVSDGMSLDIVARDLLELYQARIDGRAPRLPGLARSYADFSTTEQRRGREGFREHAKFWSESLNGSPPLLELPIDHPRPPVASARGARYHGRIDAEIISTLRDLARTEGATLFMALLAVWQTLLARLSGQTDVLVGTPVSTRDANEYAEVVGCFVNNIVLRGDLSGSPSFRALLQQTRERVLSTLRHADYPFDMIVDTLKPQRTAAYTPVFQVLFNLLASASAEDGQEMDETGSTRFDLSIELAPLGDGGMKASYEYALDLLDVTSIERMHRQFTLLLRAACEDPSHSLMNAPLMAPEEEEVICKTWNDTDLAYDSDVTVSSLIAAAAAVVPNASAVCFRDHELSYGVLDARINALAALLASKGVGPDERVAVAMPRTPDLLVALAGVLRTGAAYLPIDPSHPRERVALILEDAAAICGIAVPETAPVLAGLDTVLIDERVWSDGAPAFERTIEPQSPAYLIYTSGSTGRPKGVLVSHRNLTSFLAAMRESPGIKAGDRLLAVTTPSFDIAGLEFWLPLTSRACVVLADESDVTDGAALARLVTQHDIGILQATPTSWRLMLENGWEGKADLKALCGGEAMPLDLTKALVDRVEALWNVYGPTETTIWSAAHRVTPADLAGARIPVGRPIANTRVYVVHPGGTIAPVGAPGELLIAGDGVSLGYRNLPTLNSEKFVELSIGGRTERAYRTGDLARWRTDGLLDILGRGDHQVKIRGFRIELGEVEAALASHPGVRQGYAEVSESASVPSLVAYIVWDPDEAPTTSELRRYLSERLPDYMLPSIFVDIESVPVSPNGKVDRKRLPDPFRSGQRANRNNEPLKPGLEQMIAEIWRDHLEAELIGPFDNFYELGGHSLLSLRVAAAIEQRTGWRMDPRLLFFRTLREVAAGADSDRRLVDAQ